MSLLKYTNGVAEYHPNSECITSAWPAPLLEWDMVSLRAPDFSAFPESPYAAALRAGRAGLRFGRGMEEEYARTRLWDSRTHVRAACTLGAVLVGHRAVERLITDAWHQPVFVALLLLLLATTALAVLAWSSLFERVYEPVARVVVPTRNAIAAIPIAAGVAAGQFELLLFLPLMIIGPFFFLGLRFRTALVSVLLMLTSFAIAAAIWGLAFPFAIRTWAFLVLCAVACAVCARQFDRWCRTSFLESRLITELVDLDPLTGTKNRRVFDEQLTHLWQQAIEGRRSLAILLVDVDHFKAFNDRYGHQAGDQALRRVAQALKSHVNRPWDVLTRYGGEEFAALLYDIGAGQAEQIAQAMRRAVMDLGIEHRASRTCATVSVSIGVAAVEPASARKPRGATQLADEALYEAKMRGRNSVVLLDDTQYKLLVTGVFSNERILRS
jgi:diguanylate cyclase (GGDEF)-like protein